MPNTSKGQRSSECVRIGMPASLSGSFSQQGAQALKGVALWVEDVNRDGGLFVREVGRRLPLKLTYYDDESRSKSAAHATRRLIIDDQVDLLLGPYSSALALECASVAHSLQRLMWNHGGASDVISHSDSSWLVSVLSPASRYMEGMLELIGKELLDTPRVGIISSRRGSFPAAVASGAATYARQRGFQVVIEARYDPSGDDLVSLVDQVRLSEVHVVLGVGRIEDDLRLAGALVEGGVEAVAIGLVAAGIARFEEELGPWSERFMGPSQWEPRVPYVVDYGPSVEEMAQRLEASIEGSDYPMAQAYATALVAQRCVEEAGTLDNRTLRRVASQLTQTTFYGPFRLDESSGHQLGHSPLVVQWQRGRKVVVWPKELRQASPLFPWGSTN